MFWKLTSLLSLGLLLAAPPVQAAGFKLKSIIPADAGVRSVALADLNHDGNLDLAVASYLSDNTVSVQLGNGDGSFQPAIRYGVGTQPYGIAVSDLNLDGDLDLVVANELDDTVSVLLGNGDGTFQPQLVYSTGNGPVSLALGDFNDDGIPDVVACSADVAVLLGNGDGSFQPALFVSPQAYSAAVGDFNGDGKADLAIGTALGSAGLVQILLGNGDGSFRTGASYSLQTATPYSIAVGDLNRDGKLDLAVTTFDLHVTVLLGHGDGTFANGVDYITRYSSYGIVIDDFNRDGKLDLAVADFGVASYVSAFNGNGDGTFQTAMHYKSGGTSADSIASGDLNKDGSPDLVVGNDTSYDVSVLLNTGGTFLNTISSLNPSRVGRSVTFTTQVKQSVPGTGVPTGTVTFKDGQKSATIALANGVARFTTSKLTAGTHNITASYSGDITFNRNNAKPLVQVVDP